MSRHAALLLLAIVLVAAVSRLVFGGNQIQTPIGPALSPSPSAFRLAVPILSPRLPPR